MVLDCASTAVVTYERSSNEWFFSPFSYSLIQLYWIVVQLNNEICILIKKDDALDREKWKILYNNPKDACMFNAIDGC